MIYLIITTSINNKYGIQDDIERKNRYLYAISETLKNVPYEIKPIIVENNGSRDTYLDNFYYHHRQHVKVFYTVNNNLNFKSKGVNEFMDMKEVIERYGIEDDDIIIKLTGRYRMLSTSFFDTVIKDEKKYDAFVKFYGTCDLKFDPYICILGCYAIRAKYLKLFNTLIISNYKSAEVAFAKYVRFCGAKIKEIDNLDVECSFSDDLRILNV